MEYILISKLKYTALYSMYCSFFTALHTTHCTLQYTRLHHTPHTTHYTTHHKLCTNHTLHKLQTTQCADYIFISPLPSLSLHCHSTWLPSLDRRESRSEFLAENFSSFFLQSHNLDEYADTFWTRISHLSSELQSNLDEYADTFCFPESQDDLGEEQYTRQEPSAWNLDSKSEEIWIQKQKKSGFKTEEIWIQNQKKSGSRIRSNLDPKVEEIRIQNKK